MKRTTVEASLVVLGLVAATAGLRLYFQEIPNFAPVAAVALFAGYLFTSRSLAVVVPLGAMAVSDWFVGGYQPLLMVTVYASLTLPVVMGQWLRERMQPTCTPASVAGSIVGLFACTLAASLLFFVLTNVMVWVVTPWYARTLGGLLQCYANAVPFFRYTLAGDLTFATVLFGAHAACRVWTTAPRLAAEQLS